MMNNFAAESSDYETDDLISFQLMSQTISVSFSQLIRYSKRTREKYHFSNYAELLTQDLYDFQKSNNVSLDNIIYFFQLVQQNCTINENLTYIQCVDLLKTSSFFEVRKLKDKINEYIKSQNNDSDFVIQMIQYDIDNQEQTGSDQVEVNSELESLLVGNINECLVNDRFAQLPIPYIYRIIERSSLKEMQNDCLLDMIKTDISRFCVLFQFLDIQQLTSGRLKELCDIYQKSDETGKLYFGYLKCNLDLISRLSKSNEDLQERLSHSENINSQLQIQLKEAEDEKTLLKNQLEELKDKNSQLEKQLKESEIKIKELEFNVRGKIQASVKNGFLISAQINLSLNGVSLDTKRSKYIISTSNCEALGAEAYLKGEPIESLKMSTADFFCKAGTYFVRCIVYDVDGKHAELVSNPVTTSGRCASFDYEGRPVSVKLLRGKYRLEVWGAKGGDSTGRGSNSKIAKGGLGGYSAGTLNLDDDEVVHVYVGGEGRPADSPRGAKTSGGFPDGGGTQTGHRKSCTSVPGTGGGSTSIRVSADSAYARVIVAGGGGGASGDSVNLSPGGFGGGSSGGNCFYEGSLQSQGAGTQAGSTPGRGFIDDGNAGSFGQGASCKYSPMCDSGGAGGGGWYGGGSGSNGNYCTCSSGGGGSGWTFTESSMNAWRAGDSENAKQFLLKGSHFLADTSCVAGNSSFPAADGKGTESGHSGNGFAKITAL